MQMAGKTRLGPYEIVALLGAGGMGEVYQARDTRLDRIVAIKICKGRFSERFEREARAISSLNHQHICALYDVGREGSVEFLVMEYLEGESLEARLRKGALPMEDALQSAAEIAGALNVAHRKGVVHRDLKPGNVMLTHSGAKLLDFGLAKITPPVVFSADDPGPTAAQPITAEGTVLGTFQYMSPEQLEGKEADARTDIFAFGAMLHEMITGHKVFQGSSHASLIASVMSANPPPVSAIQPMASPALDRLVRRCLAKSPDDRWQSAGDLLSEIQWVAEMDSKAGIPAPVAARRRSRERAAWLVAGIAAVLLAAATWGIIHLQKQQNTPLAVRFQIPAPNKTNFKWHDTPALSPDGERIAFTSSTLEGIKLFVRSLNTATATEVSVPSNAIFSPFWSPDGQQIAFFTVGALQKMDATGNSPITICNCEGNGGTWNRDGLILISLRSGVLASVAAAGGEPRPILPRVEDETEQKWPQFLPDGRHYLYLSKNSHPGQQGIYLASLDSTERKLIVATDAANGSGAYVQGQLLFMRGDAIMAQPFDLPNLKLVGEPHTLANHIEDLGSSQDRLSGPVFSASANNVLVWRHSASQQSESVLQWLDRNGNRLNVVGDPTNYSTPSLSPDDRKLAVAIRDPETKTRDIWIVDLQRGTKARLTSNPADDLDPIWSPDGTRIAFTSDRKGQRDIYQKPADGSGPDELLLSGKEGAKNVESWSHDGAYLLYNYRASTQAHLYALPLAGERKPLPLVSTEFETQQGRFAPNDRWFAYRSAESNRIEVYVQAFTLDSSRPRGRWQVSTTGGELPRWRGDGKELFYRFGNTFFAVDVKTDGASFEAGTPRPLFQAVTVKTNSFVGDSPFMVARDGQRFLILAPVEGAPGEPLEVLANWR